MDYEDRIKALFEMHPSVQKEGFSSGAYKPGLDGMLEFDKVLGQPWKSWRSVHVAGTNGKGSVSCFIATALHSAGYRVGLYTSPHLLDFRERMRILGQGLISRDEVCAFLDRYKSAIQGLSFFEITTGMAFDWFRRQKADYVVVETGLGGRLDSTNIITPEVSVVTSIGLDHCALLGDTMTAIAREKAGIFKPGIPAVVWGHDEQTDAVFAEKAAEGGSRLHFADEEVALPEAESLEGYDLNGPCQRVNVRTATAVLRLGGIKPSGLEHAARECGLRGRWEHIPGSPETIVDIGHNPPALKMNFARLEKMVREEGRSLVIVYGIMADKDLNGIAPLMPACARYVLCAPDTPRAMKVNELYKRLRSQRPDLQLETAMSVPAAVTRAMDIAGKRQTGEAPESGTSPACGKPLVYIGGSTFVVSEATTWLQKFSD